MSQAGRDAARGLATRGAAVTVGGILLSGPVAVALISTIHRSVAWRGPAEYAASFYRLETAPFFFGFLLVVGYVMLFAGLQQAADGAARPRATVALLFAAAYAALATLNYLCQTTFVPALATHYRPEYDPLISALSMSNPLSLAWSIELWAYALLGAATWFAAAVFHNSRLDRWLSRLMVINGLVSIGAALAAAVTLDWVTTNAGLALYVTWNVLVLVISMMILVSLSKPAPASA